MDHLHILLWYYLLRYSPEQVRVRLSTLIFHGKYPRISFCFPSLVVLDYINFSRNQFPWNNLHYLNSSFFRMEFEQIYPMLEVISHDSDPHPLMAFS